MGARRPPDLAHVLDACTHTVLDARGHHLGAAERDEETSCARQAAALRPQSSGRDAAGGWVTGMGEGARRRSCRLRRGVETERKPEP